jgi:hypothetical protein
MRSNSSDRSSPHEVWKKIWKAKVSRKVQIFMWRVLHGIVPCLCALANRHIGSLVNCSVCTIDAEDLRCERIDHTLGLSIACLFIQELQS